MSEFQDYPAVNLSEALARLRRDFAELQESAKVGVVERNAWIDGFHGLSCRLATAEKLLLQALAITAPSCRVDAIKFTRACETFLRIKVETNGP